MANIRENLREKFKVIYDMCADFDKFVGRVDAKMAAALFEFDLGDNKVALFMVGNPRFGKKQLKKIFMHMASRMDDAESGLIEIPITECSCPSCAAQKQSGGEPNA